MIIGLTGASGFIGRAFIDAAHRRGHEIVAFSRSTKHSLPGCEMRAFTLDAPPDVRGCEAIVHLAGEPVAGLWTAEKKRRIRESRVLGTRRMVEAIAAADPKPEVFVSGSAVGYYGDSGDKELDEASPPGSGFLSEVVKAWEAEASRAEGVRTVLLRTAVVLGAKSGALKTMLPAFRLGLGGPLGNGQQWMPWIHIDDMAALALFAVEDLSIHGPLNASSPWPVRNSEFTATLAKVLHRPAFLRVPSFLLRALLGGFATEVLDSRRVVPSIATAHQFPFTYPELNPALGDLLA